MELPETMLETNGRTNAGNDAGNHAGQDEWNSRSSLVSDFGKHVGNINLHGGTFKCNKKLLGEKGFPTP